MKEAILLCYEETVGLSTFHALAGQLPFLKKDLLQYIRVLQRQADFWHRT